MQVRSPPRSCHEILGVSRTATQAEIALAYLHTAMRAHPEVHGDDLRRAQARLRFAQAAEAWAVLGHAMPIRGTGDDRDANALALFDETLGRRALSYACQRLKPDAIQRALMDEGCPRDVAWSAAQRAARLAGLGMRAGPLEGGRPLAGARSPSSAASAASASSDPSQPSTGADDPGVHDDHGVHDARLPERIASAIADAVLLFALTGAPVLMLARALGGSPTTGERLAFVAMLVGGFVYYVLAESAWGATPGKRLFGLSVKTLDGGTIDPRVAALRHGLRTLSLGLAGVGFATVLFTARRQTVHDLLTGTCVMTDGTDRPELVKVVCALPVVALLGAAAVSFV